MTPKSRMTEIHALVESLNEQVKGYKGEYDWETDKYPPTKTAIQRQITVLRTELLALSKEL